MASIHVTFRDSYDRGASSALGPARVSQTLTSSEASAATTGTTLVGEIVTITALGGAVYAVHGATPTATAGAGDLVLDGQTLILGGLPAGSKIAVINAA